VTKIVALTMAIKALSGQMAALTAKVDDGRIWQVDQIVYQVIK